MAGKKPKCVPSEERAQEIADEAEALAREMLGENIETRRLAIELFVAKEWTMEEIKTLLRSFTIQMLRRMLRRRLS